MTVQVAEGWAPQGGRALALLRDGVAQACGILGTGFLQHPRNSDLGQRLDSREVRIEDFHQNVLRIVFRLLFWAVAEERGALLDRSADAVAVDRYVRDFSAARLRHLALRRHDSRHAELWDEVTLVFTALGCDEGEPRMGLPGLGGLFAASGADVLTGARLGNVPLLAAVRAMSVMQRKGQPERTVDFRHLGAEELGAIYEWLLELVPRRDPLSETFILDAAAGNDRKTSGSYYTPSDLVELVLDTALDPILDAAEKQPDPERALLAVTVCDPAIGSGHFVVAAARRVATRLATVRTGELDPTPTMLADALHDVVGTCIYGVDVSPMAVDLAKLSLWLEAMSPGRPLSFLDHHIKVGNALLGTTPALVSGGIPDAAYVALTGDDRTTAEQWRRLNDKQRSGQHFLFEQDRRDVRGATRATTPVTLADAAWATQRYATVQGGEDALRARRVADGWCAAFLTKKAPGHLPITADTLDALNTGTASTDVVQAVDALAARHRLFHWHLEFPEIFAVADTGPANTPAGWTGGFSVMLGNPPWERVKLQEQEFFAAREPAIAQARNAAARKRAILALAHTDPALLAEFEDAKRRSEAESLFLRTSGRYPLCGAGDVNTYSVFAEHFRTSVAPTGRTGIITPTGLATDATTAAFFADTLRQRRLAAFYDFENEARIFQGVHHSFRFAVSSMTGGEPVPEVALSFVNRHVEDAVARRFALDSKEVFALNPNTGTLPTFRTRRDAEITLSCYSRHPVLMRDEAPDGNPWALRFARLFDMANDSGVFRSSRDLEAQGAEFDGWLWQRAGERWLPLYEAKLLSHYNSRYSTYANATTAQLRVQTLPRLTEEELDNPATESAARYWVPEERVAQAVPKSWTRGWFLGWRDITNAGVMRTFVPCALPRAAVGDAFLLAFPGRPEHAALLHAVWSSLVFDYISRQKMSGSHMKYFTTKQLACPTPAEFDQTPPWLHEDLGSFVRHRVLELSHTSFRMRPYAQDIVNGDPGQPFRWIPERRAEIVAELDAAMFHLYGLDRDDTEHVLDSFRVLRNYDVRDFGEFRTKRLVLAAYDSMAAAAETGTPYRSPLDPPPGFGARHISGRSSEA